MPTKLHKAISLILSVWVLLFVFLSASHIDHSHDLLPVEQSMCDEDCNKPEHRSENESCDWFIAQRVISNDEFQLNSFCFSIDFSSIIIPFDKNHLHSNFKHETYSTRAPPTLSL